MKSLMWSVLFVSVVGLCECCKCAVRPHLDLGCASDFIFKTKVTSDLQNPADPDELFGFYYTINKPCHADIYKCNFKHDVSAANKERVYTSGSSASCGVYLEEGKTYILSEFYSTSEMPNCSMVMTYSFVENAGALASEAGTKHGRVNKEKQRMEMSSCSSWVETNPISTESEQLLQQFKQGTVECPK